MTTRDDELDGGVRASRWRQLAWMVALWAAGVAALGVVAYALRGAMALLGLTR